MKANILFLSPWFPYPPDNGAKLRISNLLAALCDQHRVTLIAAYDPSSETHSTAKLEEICESVEAIPWRLHPPLGAQRLLSYVNPRPGWALFEPSPLVRQAIEDHVRSGRYDLVVACELSMAVYAESFGRVPALLEDVELGGYRRALDREQPIGQRVRGRAYWWKFVRALETLSDRFCACTVPSEIERQLLKDTAPRFGAVEVIPNCVDYGSYQSVQGTSRSGTLIYTGSLTFSANHEAMTFFLQKVYPLITRELPDIQLRITGRRGNRPLPVDPTDRRVVLTGFVDDVRPLIAESWVSIAPLLTGGGTRLKILEAMALGTPVVSTSKGAEGLAAENERHLMIADRPEDFASAVVRMCRDEGLAARLSTQARQLVAEHYDWSAVTPRFLELVERAANGSCAHRHA
jgi:glycosyltransferase involved in cell wall biosynthesis